MSSIAFNFTFRSFNGRDGDVPDSGLEREEPNLLGYEETQFSHYNSYVVSADENGDENIMKRVVAEYIYI
jgi:hypothetical protein